MNIFKIRMTLIPYLFLRLPPVKNVVRYMCKNSRFRLPFQKEHGKRVSTLFKFERQNLNHIYWSTRKQFSCEKSLLVICKSLRLFVNRMSAVDKCSLPNNENFNASHSNAIISKTKKFSQFFLSFSKSSLNFEHFQKKEDAHSLFISEATAC